MATPVDRLGAWVVSRKASCLGDRERKCFVVDGSGEVLAKNFKAADDGRLF